MITRRQLFRRTVAAPVAAAVIVSESKAAAKPVVVDWSTLYDCTELTTGTVAQPIGFIAETNNEIRITY